MLRSYFIPALLFLSYNSVDHSFVENIAWKLRDEGLDPFLDRWNLLIGTRWRPMLEKALGSSKAVAIFVGPGDMGSWQQREVDIALELQSKNANFPVIPVLPFEATERSPILRETLTQWVCKKHLHWLNSYSNR
jgi:hypothetical protein